LKQREYETCELDQSRSVPGKFLGIVGQDPSDSKSSWLHVDILRFCFYSFEAYSIDSSQMIGNSPKTSNFNRLFLKLNRSYVTNRRFSPDSGHGALPSTNP
jgi:hypothetical protein